MAARQVEQFGPKMLAFLKKAAIQTVRVKMPTKNKGVALRARLYSLRKAMQREHHPDYPSVIRVEITLDELLGEWWLIASPVSSSFDDILSEVVDIPDAPEAP